MKVENDDGYVQKRQNYILTIIYQNVLFFQIYNSPFETCVIKKGEFMKKVTQKKSKTKATREKSKLFNSRTIS